MTLSLDKLTDWASFEYYDEGDNFIDAERKTSIPESELKILYDYLVGNQIDDAIELVEMWLLTL